MEVKTKKLSKAQKLDLIKEQANALIEKTALELKKNYGPEVTEFSVYELSDAAELTQSLLDFPSNAVILNDFLAKLNLILCDLEEIPTAPLWIGKKLRKLKNAVKLALWAAEFKAEADPILSNPQSTIQQVLDVNDKHIVKYDAMYRSENNSHDQVYTGSRLAAYQNPYNNGEIRIQILYNYEWVEKESE